MERGNATENAMTDGQSDAHAGSPMHGSLQWHEMRYDNAMRLLRLVHLNSVASSKDYVGSNLWREVVRELNSIER